MAEDPMIKKRRGQFVCVGGEGLAVAGDECTFDILRCQASLGTAVRDSLQVERCLQFLSAQCWTRQEGSLCSWLELFV
eukprot:12689708-Alexandrium_andersonii.AAC.1